MNDQIQHFLNYLLDTETTSERAFIETIQNNNEFFQSRHLTDWEHMVFGKLQQVHRNTIIPPLNTEDNEEKSESEDSEDEFAASSSPAEEGDDQEQKSSRNGHNYRSNESAYVYVNIVRQCQRLLRLLHYCQRNHSDFRKLYFHSLDQCVKSDNEKIVLIALQQIASHLFEGTSTNEENEHLIKSIPSNKSILPAYQPIFTTIQTLLNPNEISFNRRNFLSAHHDILYPSTAQYLDVRREFRDTAQYFIDGDSLLLSIIHHININLTSDHGNTLHVIYIIERILFTLFNQSHQCNYTLIFFDCHSHLYQDENPIFPLLRTCLIHHLEENFQQFQTMNIRQFSSWLGEDYQRFTREEKPMFLFYHDMSNLNHDSNHLLSKEVLEKLVCFYRLFGNYHQYVLQCQLYLMNKLTLSETTVQCFQIQFHRMCPRELLEEIITTDLRESKEVKEQDWKDVEALCTEFADDDIRLFFYLKTILSFHEEHHEEYLMPLFILHVALLIRLSLVDRHFPSNFASITYSPKFSQLIGQFQQRLAFNLTSHSSTLSWAKIADLFDGRLFSFTLYQIAQSSSNLRLDSKTDEIVKQSFNRLNISSNENIFQMIVTQLIQSKDIIISSSEKQSIPLVQHRPKILKISNPFISTYLQPILSTKDPLPFELIEPDDSHIIQSQEKPLWETYKDVGDQIARVPDNDAERLKPTNHRYRTKNQQKLYDYFTLYGRSLTSRDARDNQLQIVLPTASTPAVLNKDDLIDRTESASSGKKKQQHKNQPKKAQPTKAQVIIKKNKERLTDKRANDESDKIVHVENRLKQIGSDNFSEAIDLIDESLPNFETTSRRLDLLQRKMDLQRKYLRSLKRKKNLSIEEKSKFELLQIGFFASLCEITHLENIIDAFNEKKKFMEELLDDSAVDAEKWYRFQLEKINSRLPRREQGIPDDRVPDFIPDKWQVKFLDAVDKRQSIIIVAPTASGKTYASYYAMGKVLKDKDDSNGLCVYVSPTKALINQVAGTIHLKFGPVFGVFTQDYRMNMQTCRILVTVPECLEMLLLSPIHQRWCQRIRYCIFDEMHCMSGYVGSDVWERTMLLINCPMIGLSATVNNGKQVEEWIINVENRRWKLFQTSSPRQVRLISHYERLADLNKYLYSNRQLHPIHPIGLMNAKQLTSRDVPNDFYLSPCETLRLNDAMQTNHVDTSQIPSLTDHFSPGWIAERSVCNTYSHLICEQFKDLIHNKENSTIDSISSSLNPTSSNQISYPELKPMSALIGEFVLTLKEKNLLPCIVFTDSRSLCEELAESVTQYFEEVEKELRRTKYKHQIEALEKRLMQIEKAQKSAKAKKAGKTASKHGGGGGDDDDDKDKANDKPGEIQQMEEEDQSQFRLSGYEQELLNGILEEGTLANRRHCDRDLVDRLIERASTVSPRFVRYFKRGVAYHHSQLKPRARLAVEGLFRNRYIQIVFSTWTLALGVHMPTRTVAFVKDSSQLDALQYRQSSGRAGRRGFDVQGNIVFLDIPLSKIRHLTISAIPNIQTHFPSSVTFLIRLLYFYSKAEDKKDAMNRSLVALQCPFNAQSSLSQQLIDLQLRFHCFHTLDFLYRLNLIDEEGNLIGLAGFLTHLHHFEPASLLFSYLLDTKVFHEMNDEEQIVNLLATLFTNMPQLMTHQQMKSSSTVQSNSMFNPKLSLRPIPSNIRRRIQSYNSLVKNIYRYYIENVIRKMRSVDESQASLLPLSNISFHQSPDYDNGTFEYHLHHHHSQQSQNPSISPFAGPSGLTHEQFMTNYNPSLNSWDLAYDLDLSPRILPLVDIDAHDHTNSTYYLSSYALDFFRHGSERLLLSENELDRGETFHLVSNFVQALTSIKKSLEHILTNEISQTKTNDAPFFKPLGKKFSEIEQNFSSKLVKEFFFKY